MGIKILTDFDGVWTDQALEAESVRQRLAAEAGKLHGSAQGESRQHFAEFEKRVRARPHSYGWAPDGRITAYVDEDPFFVPGAIAGYLAEASGDELARSYREAILGHGFADMNAFADRCFLEATAQFRADKPPAMVPGARLALEVLWEHGAEVIVASNSPAEKLLHWFGAAGVEAVPRGESRRRAVRVQGSAGKQMLGSSDDQIQLSGRSIYIDRPQYHELLMEERPEIVVGDVFSLDLALPWAMRRRGDAHSPRVLVLRRHTHTPAWVLNGHGSQSVDRTVQGVEELAGVARDTVG